MATSSGHPALLESPKTDALPEYPAYPISSSQQSQESKEDEEERKTRSNEPSTVSLKDDVAVNDRKSDKQERKTRKTPSTLPLGHNFHRAHGNSVQEQNAEASTKQVINSPEHTASSWLPRAGMTDYPRPSCEFYDVLILSCDVDKNKVLNLKNKFETWKLKVYLFDEFPTGKPIFKNLQDALDQCSFLVVIVTKGFLEDRWCEKRIQTAIIKSLEDPDKEDFVLPIVCGLESHQVPIELKSVSCLKCVGTDELDVSSLRRVLTSNKRLKREDKFKKERDMENIMLDQKMMDEEIQRLQKELERKKIFERKRKEMKEMQVRLEAVNQNKLVTEESQNPRRRNDTKKTQKKEQRQMSEKGKRAEISDVDGYHGNPGIHYHPTENDKKLKSRRKGQSTVKDKQTASNMPKQSIEKQKENLTDIEKTVLQPQQTIITVLEPSVNSDKKQSTNSDTEHSSDRKQNTLTLPDLIPSTQKIQKKADDVEKKEEKEIPGKDPKSPNMHNSAVVNILHSVDLHNNSGIPQELKALLEERGTHEEEQMTTASNDGMDINSVSKEQTCEISHHEERKSDNSDHGKLQKGKGEREEIKEEETRKDERLSEEKEAYGIMRQTQSEKGEKTEADTPSLNVQRDETENTKRQTQSEIMKDVQMLKQHIKDLKESQQKITEMTGNSGHTMMSQVEKLEKSLFQKEQMLQNLDENLQDSGAKKRVHFTGIEPSHEREYLEKPTDEPMRREFAERYVRGVERSCIGDEKQRSSSVSRNSSQRSEEIISDEEKGLRTTKCSGNLHKDERRVQESETGGGKQENCVKGDQSCRAMEGMEHEQEIPMPRENMEGKIKEEINETKQREDSRECRNNSLDELGKVNSEPCCIKSKRQLMTGLQQQTTNHSVRQNGVSFSHHMSKEQCHGMLGEDETKKTREVEVQTVNEYEGQAKQVLVDERVEETGIHKTVPESMEMKSKDIQKREDRKIDKGILENRLANVEMIAHRPDTDGKEAMKDEGKKIHKNLCESEKIEGSTHKENDKESLNKERKKEDRSKLFNTLESSTDAEVSKKIEDLENRDVIDGSKSYDGTCGERQFQPLESQVYSSEKEQAQISEKTPTDDCLSENVRKDTKQDSLGNQSDMPVHSQSKHHQSEETIPEVPQLKISGGKIAFDNTKVPTGSQQTGDHHTNDQIAPMFTCMKTDPVPVIQHFYITDSKVHIGDTTQRITGEYIQIGDYNAMNIQNVSDPEEQKSYDVDQAVGMTRDDWKDVKLNQIGIDVDPKMEQKSTPYNFDGKDTNTKYHFDQDDFKVTKQNEGADENIEDRDTVPKKIFGDVDSIQHDVTIVKEIQDGFEVAHVNPGITEGTQDDLRTQNGATQSGQSGKDSTCRQQGKGEDNTVNEADLKKLKSTTRKQGKRKKQKDCILQ
ncbi:uncharacterized protein LOC144443546 [Glandiceps talaboti]